MKWFNILIVAPYNRSTLEYSNSWWICSEVLVISLVPSQKQSRTWTLQCTTTVAVLWRLDWHAVKNVSVWTWTGDRCFVLALATRPQSAPAPVLFFIFEIRKPQLAFCVLQSVSLSQSDPLITSQRAFLSWSYLFSAGNTPRKYSALFLLYKPPTSTGVSSCWLACRNFFPCAPMPAFVPQCMTHYLKNIGTLRKCFETHSHNPVEAFWL